MFHKEHSIQGRKKAMDVPVRKSDRRKLRDRARSYFDIFATAVDVDLDLDLDADADVDVDVDLQRHLDPNLPWNDDDDDNDEAQKLDKILDSVFLEGNLSARSLPMDQMNQMDQGGRAWNMILYLKTPSTSQECNENWPYSTSSQFVWMALEEKDKVVRESPTVSMWAILASALPRMLTKEPIVWVPSVVSKFICRGADLMRAGMRTLPKGMEMVPIVAKGNPQPFAVGQLQTPNGPIGVGAKGVGVLIWNAYGDDLWRFSNTKGQCLGGKCHNLVGGRPFDNGNYGNRGFQKGKWVLPIVESAEEHYEESSIDEDVGLGGPASDDQNGSTQVEDEVEQLSLQDDQKISPQPTNSTDGMAELESSNLATVKDENHHAQLTPDQVLHQSVLRALLKMKKNDLPMPINVFFSGHVIGCRPEGTTIDLKSTTYKKFSSYLKIQIERGLLQASRDKSNPKNTDPLALLTEYDKRHDDFNGVSKPEHASPDSANQEKTKLVVVPLFVVQSHISSLMRMNDCDMKAANATSDERRGTGMLTASEARKLLDEYVAREELIPPDRPDQVQLDGPLTQILYAKQSKPPDTLLRKDLAKSFLSKLLPAYALVEMPGSRITQLSKGTPPPVEIEVSMRQSKKFVTRVRGLEDYGIDASYFSKDVAKRLACSTSIEATASSGRAALRKNHVEVVFQGNIANELEALLVDESLSNHGGVKGSDYSLPKNVLKINLKKGVPGTKKGGGAKK